MIYGFKKCCYNKEMLDALSWKKRFALAEQDENSGKACIFKEYSHDEIPEHKAEFFWLYDTFTDQEMIGYKPADEPQKVFVLVYSAYDSEGLWTETRVFDSLEKAITEKETYIKSELSEGNHFGLLFEDACGSDLERFQEDYVREMSDTKYHMADCIDNEYWVNIDIYEQVVL